MIATAGASAPARLSRILGLGFGLAVIFGGTVGVGILRLPGTIAGQLGSFWPILLAWIAGGCYALLGAISVAELGTAMPEAGGFYVYSKRAFGEATGFAVGWADWINNCVVIAYASVAAAEYIGALTGIPGVQTNNIALLLLLAYCALHWMGIRLSSMLQKITSSVTAITFLLLIAACWLHGPAPASASSLPDATAKNTGWLQMLVPVIATLRAIVVSYDGWYEAIYFTEEDTDAAKHLPRAMIGGVLLVIGLYLLMNLAFLRVLSIPAIAASRLPAADAAAIVFPAWSGNFVTVLSLLTLLSLINAVLMGAPRIVLAISRGAGFDAAARVTASGVPRTALLCSAAASGILIASGKFEEIIAIAAVLLAAMYSLNYLAVIVLRIREPQLARPFRAWGYPVTTVLALVLSILFLAAAVRDDLPTTGKAFVLLAAAAPVYFILRRSKQQQQH